MKKRGLSQEKFFVYFALAFIGVFVLLVAAAVVKGSEEEKTLRDAGGNIDLNILQKATTAFKSSNSDEVIIQNDPDKDKDGFIDDDPLLDPEGDEDGDGVLNKDDIDIYGTGKLNYDSDGSTSLGGGNPPSTVPESTPANESTNTTPSRPIISSCELPKCLLNNYCHYEGAIKNGKLCVNGAWINEIERCEDGIQNGLETGIDCGGECSSECSSVSETKEPIVFLKFENNLVDEKGNFVESSGVTGEFIEGKDGRQFYSDNEFKLACSSENCVDELNDFSISFDFKIIGEVIDGCFVADHECIYAYKNDGFSLGYTDNEFSVNVLGRTLYIRDVFWPGKTYNLVLTYNSQTDIIDFYIDGEKIGYVEKVPNYNLKVSDLRFNMIHSSLLSQGRKMPMTFDNLRIYNSVFVPEYSRDLPESDLLAYYKFDETEGIVAHDSSGNEYHGKIMGDVNRNVNRVEGYEGGAFDFYGINQYQQANEGYVKVPFPKGIDNEYTIEAWIKPRGLNKIHTISVLWGQKYTAVTSGRTGYFFDNKYQGASFSWSLRGDSDKCLNSYLLNSASLKSTSCRDYWLDNKWHHVAYVYDNGVSNLYVDGNLEATATKEFNFPQVGVMDIGVQWYGRIYRYDFQGAIDEVKIWNVAKEF